MNKRMVKSIGTYLACVIIAFCVLSYVSGSEWDQGEMKEHIKQSMKETKVRNEKIKAFHSELNKKFRKRGFEGQILASTYRMFSSEPPSITVRVYDKQYKHDHEKDIKHFIRGMARSYDFGDVAINVKVEGKAIKKINKKDQQRMKRIHELFDVTREVLKQEGYSLSEMSLEPPIFNIKIKGSEQYYNKVKKDINKLAQDIIQKKHLEYSVKVKRKKETEKRDEKWQPIFRSIREETDKQFSKVTGFAYSFHPMPLQIIVKTSLSNGWLSWGTKNRAEDIEKYVKQVIEIKRKALSVEKIPYKIIVKGEEHKKLN